MNRPYIFMHMLTSLDGKIMGEYFNTQKGEQAVAAFYNLAFGENPELKMDAWMCGRVTSDDNFTFYEKPELDEDAEEVPKGDYVGTKTADKYYVSLDTKGVLGWKSNTITYDTTPATVIEVLTGKASNAYKAMLRKLDISYIIAGEEELDKGLALTKLKEMFGIKTLMLGGGGIINWAFIKDGFCDELNIVLAPSADGSNETPSLFSTGGFTEAKGLDFKFKNVQVLDGESLWIRYVNENAKH